MSGQRFLLASGDKCLPEGIGPRINELYKDLAPLPSTAAKAQFAKKVSRNLPAWMRVSVENRKVRDFLGYDFFDWDDTLKATVDSLLGVGGVRPAGQQ